MGREIYDMYTHTLDKPTSTSVAPEFESVSFIVTPKKIVQYIKTTIVKQPGWSKKN